MAGPIPTVSSPNTDPTPIRAAVVGLGKMGLVHASTIRTHPRVDLVAFCDTSKFMIEALGPFFPGIRFYNDYKKLLAEEELSVVYVTTPTESHVPIVCEAASTGRHVFVEKPLAASLSDAESAEKAITKGGVRSQIGFVCRYAPTFENAKKLLDAGVIGRVTNFSSVKYSSDVLHKVEKSWRFMGKKSAGAGGVVNDLACHAVDLIVWMFGEPKGVQARLESWYSREVEDYAHIVLDYGDFSGWIDSSWSMQDYRKPYNKIEVTGDNGRLIVTDSELRYMVKRSHDGYEAGWYSKFITDFYEPVRIFVGDIMFTRQADGFLDSITGGPPSRSEAREALRTQRVLEAIHKGEKR